jgi:hypothetical protein
MDGQNNNPKNNQKPNHGLRLIRGGSSQQTIPSTQSSSARAEFDHQVEITKPTLVTPSKPVRRNPLLMQLNALADAIDNDVKQILKL